jgi:opacity protein-like surface antigen
VKTKPILIAAALALAGTAGAASAQYANNYRPVANNGFWQGAPDGLQQRIDWLQQRIQRGRADGSLDRQEARRAQLQLDALRRDANVLQQRLDDLSRNIRWSRNNGYGRDLDRYRTDYDASRYYREDPRYRESRLGANDEVYRGSDGRYYCKRSDGTIGLVVGGVGGAALGNIIDGGGNRLAGTLIGGALGALLGQAVDRNSDLRCR